MRHRRVRSKRKRDATKVYGERRDKIAVRRTLRFVHARILLERFRVSAQSLDHPDEYYDTQQHQQVCADIFYRILYGLLHLVRVDCRRRCYRDDLRGALQLCRHEKVEFIEFVDQLTKR